MIPEKRENKKQTTSKIFLNEHIFENILFFLCFINLATKRLITIEKTHVLFCIILSRYFCQVYGLKTFLLSPCWVKIKLLISTNWRNEFSTWGVKQTANPFLRCQVHACVSACLVYFNWLRLCVCTCVRVCVFLFELCLSVLSAWID